MARGRNGAGKANGTGKKRGRPSKKRVEAKEDAVEVRKGQLDIPEPVTLKADDFNLHFKSTKAATEKVMTAQSLLRSCYKAAKQVSPELLDAVKYAMKIERLDPEDVKRELAVRGFVLKQTGSHVQLTLHDTLLGDVLEVAYKRGKDDALNGRGANNPYPEGSELAESYNAGWRNGIGAQFGMDEAQTAAAVAGDSDGPFPPDHNETTGLDADDPDDPDAVDPDFSEADEPQCEAEAMPAE